MNLTLRFSYSTASYVISSAAMLICRHELPNTQLNIMACYREEYQNLKISSIYKKQLVPSHTTHHHHHQQLLTHLHLSHHHNNALLSPLHPPHRSHLRSQCPFPPCYCSSGANPQRYHTYGRQRTHGSHVTPGLRERPQTRQQLSRVPRP